MNKTTGITMNQILLIIIILTIFYGAIFIFIGTQVERHKLPDQVCIPSHNMIQTYYEVKGFDNGWLSSSSCGVNEVQCHRQIGSFDEYQCIEWGK